MVRKKVATRMKAKNVEKEEKEEYSLPVPQKTKISAFASSPSPKSSASSFKKRLEQKPARSAPAPATTTEPRTVGINQKKNDIEAGLKSGVSNNAADVLRMKLQQNLAQKGSQQQQPSIKPVIKK